MWRPAYRTGLPYLLGIAGARDGSHSSRFGAVHPLLTRLDQWLAATRPAYYAALAPAAAAADIEEIAERVDTELPPLLRELLTWKNGQDYYYPGALESGWRLMSADSIADALDIYADLVANDDYADLWGTDWVPFLQNIFGDYLVIDLQGAFDGEPGQIVCFHCKDERRDILFPSLEAWLDTLVAALESGLLAEEEDQDDYDTWGPVDDEAYESFCAARYPGYPRYVVWMDYCDDTALDPGPANLPTKSLLHALDVDRLRSVLGEYGLNNQLIDNALGRVNTRDDPGSSAADR